MGLPVFLRSRRPRWQRVLFAAAGSLFLALGLVGLVMPLLPGVVFLTLAAACFSRASTRFEIWLLTRSWLGPLLRRWQLPSRRAAG
ncbi:YbaN family protein [Chelatococcus sp. SYSU_G07232]|uniref:YbaN family protein n=2 Tax=Chelatococcus albus TaxID=3047466 RepID=A0ABT7ABZ9_9HYPH|nr:YbaN family protein [Chelatococcus sp. SYSU_G07232]